MRVCKNLLNVWNPFSFIHVSRTLNCNYYSFVYFKKRLIKDECLCNTVIFKQVK
ncbi:hypothetical protein BD770DRAFT_394881 [Pilaira anomala]|nr:hypothetical protein BD770DRAFT_394881 [Pilaira anomala]